MKNWAMKKVKHYRGKGTPNVSYYFKMSLTESPLHYTFGLLIKLLIGQTINSIQ